MKIEVKGTDIILDGTTYRADGTGTSPHEVIYNGVTYKAVVAQVEKEVLQVNTDVLNFRTLPDTSATIISTFRRGQLVDAYEKVGPNDGWWWRKIIHQDRAGYAAQENTSGTLKYLIPPTGGTNPPPTGDIAIVNHNGKYIFSFKGKKSLQWQCINVRPLAFKMGDNQIHDICKFALAHKIPVIRFYASNVNHDAKGCGERVKHTLDILHGYGLKGQITLDDSLSISGMTYRADNAYNERYRRGPDGHKTYNWYIERMWRQYLFPQMDGILKVVGYHPAVFCFSLPNEWSVGYDVGKTRPITSEDATNAKIFANEGVRFIRARTPHMVSLDIISGAHVTVGGSLSEVLGFYNYSNPSFVDCHIYGQQSYNDTQDWGMDEQRLYLDAEVARLKRIPFVLGEFGSYFRTYQQGYSRRAILGNALNRFHQPAVISYWFGNDDIYSWSANLSDFNDITQLFDATQNAKAI